MDNISINNDEKTIYLKIPLNILTSESAVEMVIQSSKLIQESTMEIIYYVLQELSDKMSHTLYRNMKDIFLEEIIQMVSDGLNIDEYKALLKRYNLPE